MTTKHINFLLKQINSLTYKTAMVVEFYDVFGWKTNRRIYKVGELFTVEFICPNGKALTKIVTKKQVMNFMINNDVIDSFIIKKY